MDQSLQNSITNIINQQDVGQNNVVENLLNFLYEINFKDESATKNLSELFDENIDKWQSAEGTKQQIKTGFDNLDNIIGGFFPGELVVIGSRPAEGKTQFLIDLALNISKEHSALFYSYDHSQYLISSRFISTLSGIPLEDLLRRNITIEQKGLLQEKISELSDHKLLIHSGTNTSINAFKLMSTKFMKENGVKVIFIDFVQLLSSTKYKRNREQEISHVSRELKKFAKENMILIVATSQLSRALEYRKESKVPMLTDLRESGSIEQDADKVLFIYRPDFDTQMGEDTVTDGAVETQILVAKNRNGTTGMVQLFRDPNFTTFDEARQISNLKFTFSDSRLQELK